MNIPTFDNNGNIDMSEVLMANLKDFEQFDIDVAYRTKIFIEHLNFLSTENYSKEKFNYIYMELNKYTTSTQQIRKPQTELLPLYCFYYKLYSMLVNSPSYYHMDEVAIKKLDMDMLDCECRRIKNPYTFWGHSNPEFIKSYKGKIVTIPAGCHITANGKKTVCKRRHNVLVALTINGFYYKVVSHPKLRWCGKDGWNEALFKDVFAEL